VTTTDPAFGSFTPFGLGDWDRDGHQDIVARENSTGDLYLYPGEGHRAPSRIDRVQIGNGWLGFTPFGVCDWDGDGHQDIVTREDATGDLYLYPGESRRGPSRVDRVQIGNGWSGFTPFGVCDWDGDGHQDIVTREDATGDLYLYPGESRRGPSRVDRVQIGNGWSGFTPFGVCDWDGDGHQDIVTREDATGDLYVYPGESRRGPSRIERAKIGNGW
jgi:VCBS repeat protein